MTAETITASRRFVRGRRDAVGLFGVFLAVFAVPMSVAGSAVALPAIAVDLGSATQPLQWVVNSFNVAFAVSTVFWGRFADRFGHKGTFMLGAAIFVAGSAWGAAADSILALDLSRAVVGVGATAVLTSTTSILSVSLEGAARTRAFAVLGTVFGVGLAFGPTGAGLLVEWVGWRGVFAGFGVATLAGAVFAARLRVPRLDADGSAHGYAVLLRDRSFLAVCLVPVVQACGFIAVMTYLPVAFSSVWNIDAGHAGLVMLFMTGPLLLGSPAGAWLTRRGWPLQRVLTVSLGFLAVGDLLLLAVSPSTSFVVVAAGMVCAGVGFGLPIGLLDGAAQTLAPRQASGAAAGLFNLIRLGAEAAAGAAFGAGLSALVRWQLSDTEVAARTLAGAPGHAETFSAGWRGVLLLVSLLVCVGGVAAMWLLRRGTARRPA